MLAISTLTLTTLSSDEPAAASICSSAVSTTRVSVMIGPRSRWPVAGSIAASPETNRNGPPRTSVEAGWPSAAAMSRFCGGETIVRAMVIGGVLSGGRDRVELDLEARLALGGPHRAGWRTVGDVLAIDPVEHVVLDAVVDQRVHLDE